MKNILNISFLSAFVFILMLQASSQDDKKEYHILAEELYYSSSNKTDLYEVILYCDTVLSDEAYTDDSYIIAHITRIKGSTYWRMDSLELAIEQLRIAQANAKEIEAFSVQAMAELHLGYVYYLQSINDSVMPLYNSALELYEDSFDTAGIAKVLNNITIFYLKRGDPADALKAALRVNRIQQKSGNPRLYITSLINLANVYKVLKRLDTALSCYNIAYQLSVDNKLINLEYKAITNIAVIYFDQKKFEESRDALLTVIEYCKREGLKRDLALYYRNIVLAYTELGETQKAEEALDKALAIYNELDDVSGKVSVYRYLGNNYVKLGKQAEAESYFKKSLEMAEEIGQKDDISKAYSKLSALYEEQGRYEEALTYHKMLLDVNKEILGLAQADAIEKYEAEYKNLHLKDQNTIKELENKRIQSELNITYISIILAAIILIWAAIYFRMKGKKNRIISAQRIKQLEDEKKILSAQSVILGQEEERKRIARELHDGIGVLLSTARIHFSAIEDTESPEMSKEVFQKANRMLEQAGTEVRKISHNMMPGVLSKFGLRDAIEDLFDELEDTGQIRTDVSLICSSERLAENMEITIYRVMQELINNTLKHAEATEIRCNLIRKTDSISILYSDNGKGFDADSMSHHNGLGISGIRSRVDFLSGQLDLISKKGEGTTYKIEIPLSVQTKPS